jgi:hypothetical protein
MDFEWTTAGLNAIRSPNNQGLQIDITHIAFGTGNRAFNATFTSLANEKERVAISSATPISNGQNRITGVLPDTFTGADYWVGEIGLIGDGVLVALACNTGTGWTYRRPNEAITVPINLVWGSVPVSALNIVVEPLSTALQIYVDDKVTWHEAKADPHPQYTTQQELQQAIVPATQAELNAGTAGKLIDAQLARTQFLSTTSDCIAAGIISFGRSNMGIDWTLPFKGQLEVYGHNISSQRNAAKIAFHLGGQAGAYLGMDVDNQLKWGGWTLGAPKRIWHEGNLPEPSLQIYRGEALGDLDNYTSPGVWGIFEGNHAGNPANCPGNGLYGTLVVSNAYYPVQTIYPFAGPIAQPMWRIKSDSHIWSPWQPLASLIKSYTLQFTGSPQTFATNTFTTVTLTPSITDNELFSWADGVFTVKKTGTYRISSRLHFCVLQTYYTTCSAFLQLIYSLGAGNTTVFSEAPATYSNGINATGYTSPFASAVGDSVHNIEVDGTTAMTAGDKFNLQFMTDSDTSTYRRIGFSPRGKQLLVIQYIG